MYKAINYRVQIQELIQLRIQNILWFILRLMTLLYANAEFSDLFGKS